MGTFECSHTGGSVEVPRYALQFLELGDGITIVFLVCEDLAQIDNVAEVVRSVGPTVIYTPLLNGPQLSSRWAARYASVFADDPGSAVGTLTSYGTEWCSAPALMAGTLLRWLGYGRILSAVFARFRSSPVLKVFC